jgi:hypothetical protein
MLDDLYGPVVRANVVKSMIGPDELGDLLHDAVISFDTLESRGDGVAMAGSLDERGLAFRFELSVSKAHFIRAIDPDQMGWFQLGDCRLSGGRLLIWGDGPVGSVEIEVTPQSTYQVSFESDPFIVRRFGRWKPVAPDR